VTPATAADPEAVGHLYKVTGAAGECLNGGSGAWSLPANGQPGAWWDIAGEVAPCYNGLHLATAAQLPQWLPVRGTFRVWRAETRGVLLCAGEKYVAASARLLPADDAASRRHAAAAKRHAAAVKKADRAYLRTMAAAARMPAAPPAVAEYLRAIGAANVPPALAAVAAPHFARAAAEADAARARAAAHHAARGAFSNSFAAFLAAL
jgi:hypothetical protein